MPSEVESQIIQAQRAILQQLVELVPKDRRGEAVRLVDQFWGWSRALSGVSPPPNIDRYTTKFAIDAIRAYLEDIDHPAEYDEIIREVASRGFKRGSEKRTKGNIKKSLDMYLQGQARHKRELKQIGDLVGLPDWDDSRFKPTTRSLTLT